MLRAAAARRDQPLRDLEGLTGMAKAAPGRLQRHAQEPARHWTESMVIDEPVALAVHKPRSSTASGSSEFGPYAPGF